MRRATRCSGCAGAATNPGRSPTASAAGSKPLCAMSTCLDLASHCDEPKNASAITASMADAVVNRDAPDARNLDRLAVMLARDRTLAVAVEPPSAAAGDARRRGTAGSSLEGVAA